MFVSIGATLVSATSHLGFDTTADKAAGEPLARWLTVVALKVWYLLAWRSMRPTNLTLSPCWEIDRKSKERGKEKNKNVIVRDDGVGCERGQVSGGFLTHFSLYSPLLPQSPPWLQGVSDRSPCYHCLYCWAALERCDQQGGSQLSFCYSLPSSAIGFALFSLSVRRLTKTPASLQPVNFENIHDLLTSNNPLSFSHLLFSVKKCFTLSLFLVTFVPCSIHQQLFCMLSHLDWAYRLNIRSFSNLWVNGKWTVLI